MPVHWDNNDNENCETLNCRGFWGAFEQWTYVIASGPSYYARSLYLGLPVLNSCFLTAKDIRYALAPKHIPPFTLLSTACKLIVAHKTGSETYLENNLNFCLKKKYRREILYLQVLLIKIITCKNIKWWKIDFFFSYHLS